MEKEVLLTNIERLKQKHGNIYVIVAPPRCSSTALARVFWEQDSIRYYSHEPFERTYYWHEGLEDVFKALESPIDLVEKGISQRAKHGNELIIKEMPYQVGDNFSVP